MMHISLRIPARHTALSKDFWLSDCIAHFTHSESCHTESQRTIHLPIWHQSVNSWKAHQSLTCLPRSWLVLPAKGGWIWLWNSDLNPCCGTYSGICKLCKEPDSKYFQLCRLWGLLQMPRFCCCSTEGAKDEWVSVTGFQPNLIHAPNAGELDSILGQGTKSHMSQLKKKVQHATVNPEHQINKCIIF